MRKRRLRSPCRGSSSARAASVIRSLWYKIGVHESLPLGWYVRVERDAIDLHADVDFDSSDHDKAANDLAHFPHGFPVEHNSVGMRGTRRRILLASAIVGGRCLHHLVDAKEKVGFRTHFHAIVLADFLNRANVAFVDEDFGIAADRQRDRAWGRR